MKMRKLFAGLALVGAAVIGLSAAGPAKAQIDVTIAGSSASDLLNDKAIEAICGGTFTRFTRTGSSGNGCPSSTNASIRAYTCTVRFCSGGTRAGKACIVGSPDPSFQCPGGTCPAGGTSATLRLSGFGSEFGVDPINGNCTDANGLCNANQVLVLNPSSCNLGGTGGNNNCACEAVGTGAENVEDLGVSDVKGPSFIPSRVQPTNSAAPAAVPFKFIINKNVTTGICNGGTNNALNCNVPADCPSGTCVQTQLPRLSVTEAQNLWGAGIGSWSQICWNPDTFTCDGGTKLLQSCNPNNTLATECPKTLPADPQPNCVSCTAFGPAKPIRVCPRTSTSGTRACQIQVTHASTALQGIPFAPGAGPNVDVFYPTNIGGDTTQRPGCPDTTTQSPTFPFGSTPGADGLCDDCPDLDGDGACDIVVREGTATGDVDNCVQQMDGSIGFIAADRFSVNYYATGYDRGIHSLDAMRNGASSLWCSLTYNKLPNNTYDTNTLNAVNSVIDRINTASFLNLQAPTFSTDADMKVFKNLDRGPILYK